MANDMDMLKDIAQLKKCSFTFRQAIALEDLFTYVYGLGESKFKTKIQFETAKRKYKEEYGDLDNYV